MGQGTAKPRVALVHDWLCGYRGGEAVLERLAAIFDPVALLVMFDDGAELADRVDQTPHIVSALGRLPGASRTRRWLLPAYPLAVASLSRSLARMHAREPIDLVISSSSAAVKGIRPPPGVPHLCYCHSPARYLWGRGAASAGGGTMGRVRRAGLSAFGRSLRRWDRHSAVHVSRFVANSTFIAREIRRCYARDAAVVHPPVRTDFYTPSPTARREDFWLVAGALEPYKRVDLAIQAARAAGQRLIIAGSGTQEARLRRMALNVQGVEFLGRVTDEQLRGLYRRARLLLFPPIEDFGIVPVEAQACGLPVVARRAGGALDSVIDGITGSFFDVESVDAILAAVAVLPGNAEHRCRRNAERFSEAAFDSAMQEHATELLHDTAHQE